MQNKNNHPLKQTKQVEKETFIYICQSFIWSNSWLPSKGITLYYNILRLLLFLLLLLLFFVAIFVVC